MDDTRFTTFSFLFALAACGYHAQIGLSWILVFAAWVLLKPSSVPRFLVFVLLQTLLIYSELPQVNTNRTLTFFLGLAILLPSVPKIVAARGRLPAGTELLAACEPLLRLEVLIVYLMAFWHKLNEDFLDPRLSCATAIYGQLRDAVAWVPLPVKEDVAVVMITATLLLEGLLPVALFLRVTRKWAVAVGVLFHFMLGMVWFYSFSATMIALLFLFLPADFSSHARRFWHDHSPRILLGLKIAVPAGGLIVLALALLLWDSALSLQENFQQAKPWIKQLTWFGWCSLALPIAVFLHLLRKAAPSEQLTFFRGPQPVWLLIPLLTVMNGLSPYLGLKTETAFAMYSNLRTEGGRSNHLVVRRPLALADYQTDLVEVLESSDPRLARTAERGEPIPFVLLRRRIREASVARVGDVRVTYVRDGVRREVSAAQKDPELAEPLTYPEWKLLVFRTILVHGENICVH